VGSAHGVAEESESILTRASPALLTSRISCFPHKFPHSFSPFAVKSMISRARLSAAKADGRLKRCASVASGISIWMAFGRLCGLGRCLNVSDFAIGADFLHDLRRGGVERLDREV
jgi:hypothetical protein